MLTRQSAQGLAIGGPGQAPEHLRACQPRPGKTHFNAASAPQSEERVFKSVNTPCPQIIGEKSSIFNRLVTEVYRQLTSGSIEKFLQVPVPKIALSLMIPIIRKRSTFS